jgi:hypothetical protein
VKILSASVLLASEIAGRSGRSHVLNACAGNSKRSDSRQSCQRASARARSLEAILVSVVLVGAVLGEIVGDNAVCSAEYARSARGALSKLSDDTIL